MTKALKKDLRREIKKSIARFISIMLIVALGVAFYSGVRSTMPAMHSTADAAYDKEDLMDIRVVGTLGLTEDDLETLKAIEGVENIEGSYTTDFLCIVNSKEIVTRVISMAERINGIKIHEGRYPEKYNECVVSQEFLNESGLEIGKTVTLSTGTDDEVSDTLVTNTYLIVGVCSSTYYLNGEVGTSSIGDGTGDGYIVIPRQAFVTDVFTSIYITVEGAKELNCYEDKYDDLVDTVVERIKEIADERCEIRFTEISSKSSDTLAKAKADYEEAQLVVQEEIQNAADQLREQEQLIEQSKQEIQENKELLENAEVNLPIYEQQVADAEKQIAEGEEQIAVIKQALNESKASLDNAVESLKEMQQDPDADPDQVASMTQTVTAMQDAYNYIQQELIVKEQELEQGKKDLVQAKVTLGQLQSAVANKGSLDDAEQEIMDADAMLKDARAEYETFKQDALAELADAEAELQDAERKINEMEAPVWHVLDRNSIETYVSYITDSDSIGAIGTVFPMIFFFVAALVSLTTMARMVEEERTQIGTLKALGYDKKVIVSKYLKYSATASIIGSVIGAAVGEISIPPLIITAYKAVYYNLGDNILHFNVWYAVSAGVVATLCTTLAAYFACYYSMRSVPASLMRPVAPKAGKRTFIEKIPFIWQRLNFGQKSAFRNLFRYKKRFFMTLFGVGGCMALLIVGLGIRDSVSMMTDKQYGEIFNYTSIVSVDSSITRAQRRSMLSKISGVPNVEGYIQANRTMISATSVLSTDVDDEKSAYLIVPADVDQFPQFVTLKERTGDKKSLNLSDEGVIITEKYADLLDVQAGDNIYLKIDDTTVTPKKVKVIGISENYIFNYIYMTPALYQTLYYVEPEINILMMRTNGLLNDANFKTALSRIDGVNSVTTSSDELESINKVINNLYFIIILMVVSAAVLAFVVLYNLNNINITERRRELATFKLLGFYNNELASYVYRENVILTALGIILGIIMGVVLHRFVMVTVETDVYMFGRELEPVSIVIAIVLTIIFTVIVNAITYLSLKKIDMVESLKSVE
ncbi:MAG: ABC transporter permease [Clostridia bacterium]|nr:ABC transporter permease [Clostridia bacterium]